MSENRFGGGQDYYDLSRLNPQFTVDTVALYSWTPDCNDFSYSATRYIDGVTTARWDDKGNIIVALGGTTCHYSNGVDMAQEVYNIRFNVTGPRGVDPAEPL